MINSIGFVGSKGAGKSTFARALACALIRRRGQTNSFPIWVTSFAEPLKQITKKIFPYLTEADFQNKDIAVVEKTTLRKVLQHLGSEFFRDVVNKNHWIDIMSRRLKAMKDSGGLLIVDDVRFQNELELFDVIIEINEDSQVKQDSHQSENGLEYDARALHELYGSPNFNLYRLKGEGKIRFLIIKKAELLSAEQLNDVVQSQLAPEIEDLLV